MALTGKQARFIRAYAKCLNGTEAALEAGYSSKSRAEAAQKAYRVMRHPEVRAAIEGMQARAKLDESLSAARVLEELRRMAFVDLRSLYDEKGDLKDIKDWTAEQGSAVQEVQLLQGNVDKKDGKRDTVLKIRLWDKTKALEMLAKHYSLTTEKTEITGGITVTWLAPETAAPPVAAVDGEVLKALPPAVEGGDA